jgi:hypothetical protein
MSITQFNSTKFTETLAGVVNLDSRFVHMLSVQNTSRAVIGLDGTNSTSNSSQSARSFSKRGASDVIFVSFEITAFRDDIVNQGK